MNLEKFWSEIYNQQVAEKSLVHWEIYEIIPSGNKQESQFLRVSIFFNLSKALSFMYSSDVIKSAQIAYPQKNNKLIRAMIDSTKMLRNIYEQVLYEQIDKGQKVDFNYPIGFVAALELSQQTDNSYEQVVTDVFKPFYQTLINDGKVGHWGFMHVILPYGNDVNTTHTSFLFFKDMDQLANFMIESNYPTFIKSTPEFETGLKTRDLKKLIMKR